MKHELIPSALALLFASTSTLFAQPGTGEAPVPDGAPEEPVTAPPVIAPVAPPPPPPQSAVGEPDPQPEEAVATGFALEMRLDSTTVLLGNDAALPAITAGLFLGHRSRSLTIGVGFDFGRFNQSTSSPGGSSEMNSTTVLVIPGVRFVLARTADQKTEILGQVDAGYGVSIRRAGAGGTDPDNINRLRVQAGPSLRHWITPSFAIGGTVGLRYDRASVSSDQGMGMTSEQILAITALFGSLNMTGVF